MLLLRAADRIQRDRPVERDQASAVSDDEREQIQIAYLPRPVNAE